MQRPEEAPAQNGERACVIAGNGPSLAEIDYARLPKDFDVFRCNQFYFEDKYYLGKRIKATTFATWTTFEQVYTLLNLKQNQEYDIDHVFLHDLRFPRIAKSQEDIEAMTEFLNHNVFIQRIYEGIYSKNIAEFLEHSKLQALYFYKNYTSGLYLCAIAIALGYTELHLCGIDFYEGKSYAFDDSKPNFLSVMPKYGGGFKLNWLKKQEDNTPPYHSRETDLEGMEFLSKHYKARFYCLSPSSPLSRHLPLSPIVNASHALPVEKPKECTRDLLIPSEYAYLRNKRAEDPRVAQKSRLKNNFYFKIIKDLVRLPSDIKHYFKKD